MTLQNLAVPIEWPSGLMGSSQPNISSSTMDAAGEGVAYVLVAPKAGNIHKIGFFTGTVTTPQSLDVRVETLDGSGNPSGTLWGTNTKGTQASPATNTWYWVTLTADAVVAQGDIFCVNVQWVSTVGNLVINHIMLGVIGSAGLPYVVANTGSWAKSGNAPLCAIEYDNGTRTHCGSYPLSSTTLSQNINTGTTPDEAGLRFRVPVACKVVGANVKANATATTYAVKLYDSDGSTVLASVTAFDSDWKATTGAPRRVIFSSPVTLAADTTYRLTILPEAATNVTVYRIGIDSAGTLEAWPGGAQFYWTQRTDAGAWTEDQTKVPQISLLVSALDDGASAGGMLRHPGMSGGLNG